MADGSVDFQIRLINQVTRPANQIKREMAGVRKAFDQTRATLAAPTPRNRRGALSGFDQRLAGARRSQVRDFARDQARMTRLRAAEQAKAAKSAMVEAKRVQAFQRGMVQHKLDQQSGIVDMATSGLKYATFALGAAALAAVAAVAYLGAKFAAASVEAAAFGERSRLALSFLIGNAPLAAQQFDALRHEAAGLGLDVERTQMSFQKLLAAQFEVGKARELIRMGSDLQAIGAKAEDVEGVLLAITQIKSKGRLQAEEMLQLQERGISADLVYSALEKRLGKNRQQIMKLQQKGQLGGPEAIEAILEAVRKKTGTEFAGQAGEEFAKTTLAGMVGVWKAKGQNFLIDVGDKILPSLQKLSKLVSSGLDKLLADPKLQQIGSFLLRELEYFTLWVEAEWPSISSKLLTGAQLFGEGLRFAVEMLDINTVKGKVTIGVLGLLAATLGIVALAGFVLMLPLYLLIGVIGLVAYAIYKAISWVVDAVSSLTKFLPGNGIVEKNPTSAAMMGGYIPGSQQLLTTAAETGAGARVGANMTNVSNEIVTVASEEQNVGGPQNHFDFSGMSVGANVDQDDLMAKIRSQVTKAIEESA